MLRETQKMDNLTVSGSRIMLFPDYTALVQRRRNNYMVLKRQLRELELPYSLLFPVRL